MTSWASEYRCRTAAPRGRFAAACLALVVSLAAAQTPPEEDAGQLAERQRRIASQYRRLDAALLRLAEVLAKQEPVQAQVVRDAAGLSRERLVQAQLERLIADLEARRLKPAVDGQQAVTDDLQRLLEMLTQGDPRERLRNESQRLQAYLREMRRLSAAQRSTQQATESPGDPKSQTERQGQHAEAAGELAERMKREDASGGAAGGSSEPAPTSKASESLQKAQEAMRQAREALEQAQRDQALDEQRKALERLAEAQAEVERILRQLRETERQQALAELETRFREMLREEIEIREATVKLDEVSPERRGPNEEVAASRLARRQGELQTAAEAVLTLLREDGTALAMAEAVSSVRSDMAMAARRLDVADVGKLTQAIEDDVVTALEELIAAVKKARQDAESDSQSGQGGQGAPPGAQPLVDLLAELKVIRALQYRINQRTERYHRSIAAGESAAPDLAGDLSELGKREQRVFEATRNLIERQNAEGGGP